MTRLSRRTLLTGSGVALIVSIAGCIEDSGNDDDVGDDGTSEHADTLEEQLDVPSGLAPAFSYLFAPDDPFSLYFHPYSIPVSDLGPDKDYLQETLAESSEVDWVLNLEVANESEVIPFTIWTGSFELTEEGTEHGDFILVDIDDDSNDEVVFATDGTIGITGGEPRVESVLENADDDEAPYLSSREDIVSVVNSVVSQDGGMVFESELLEAEFDSDAREDYGLSDVQFPTAFGFSNEQPEDGGEMTWLFAGWYDDGADGYDDDFTAIVESVYALDTDDATVSTEESLVSLEKTEEYVPPEERPDPPGLPEYVGYDVETDEVLFKFGEGDPVAVEYVTIEIDDDPIADEWTSGIETVDEGTVVGIPWDAVEPGDTMTVTFEDPDMGGTSSVGSNILSFFPVAIQSNPAENEATVEYLDGPPLPQEQVSIAVYDDRQAEQEEPRIVELPETLGAGESVVVDDVEFENVIRIIYERADGESVNIGGGSVMPPGDFEVSFEPEQESARVIFQEPGADDSQRQVEPEETEPVVATNYEIRHRGEPAATQFSDENEYVEPGDEVTIKGVTPGDDLAVDWIGDGGYHNITSTVAAPSVSFTYEYDADANTLSIEQTAEQAIDLELFTIEGFIEGEQQEREPVEDVEKLEPGKRITVEDIDQDAQLFLLFAEKTLDTLYIGQLLAD